MGALRVHAICHYRGTGNRWPAEWRDVDIEARNLITALKQFNTRDDREPPPFSSAIGVGSNQSNPHETPLAFVSRLMLRAMHDAGYDGAAIIPIPSTRHLWPASDFAGARIARAIARRDAGFTSTPALYFAHPVPQSDAGRRRTETALRVNLRATSLRGLRRVVLLDDVMTTGAHLKAAAAFLSDRGIIVEDAFVVARLATHCPDFMFSVPATQI